MIVRGVPNKDQTRAWSNRAVPRESMVALVGINMTILENRSTTTRIESMPADSGKPVMKSIDTISHGYEGI